MNKWELAKVCLTDGFDFMNVRILSMNVHVKKPMFIIGVNGCALF